MALTESQREYQRDWYEQNKEERRRVARAHMKTWRQKNPEVARARDKKWKLENPDHLRNYLLKKNYGITLEQRDRMFLEQDSKCAVCRTDKPQGKNWHVDHCHSTGVVRGILCSHCNLMIGHAKDKAETLLAAVKYLKR